jgi:hypothetical protein
MAFRKKTSKTEEVDKDKPEHWHPSQDETTRFPLDQLLRQRGFQIHRRRQNSEPVWLLKGIVFKQSEAILHLKEGDVLDAEMIARLRYDES